MSVSNEYEQIAMFYTVGIKKQRIECEGWCSSESSFHWALRSDVNKAFNPLEHDAAQMLLCCEFGPMGVDSLDPEVYQRFFEEEVLQKDGMSNIKVVCQPPYVALINSDIWTVEESRLETHVLSDSRHGDHVSQYLRVRNVQTGKELQLFNVCVPDTCNGPAKKNIVCSLIDKLLTKDTPWILGGNLNMYSHSAIYVARNHVHKRELPHAISACYNGVTTDVDLPSNDARIADHVLLYGICTVQVRSWIGKNACNSNPCDSASDEHNAIVVRGFLCSDAHPAKHVAGDANLGARRELLDHWQNAEDMHVQRVHGGECGSSDNVHGNPEDAEQNSQICMCNDILRMRNSRVTCEHVNAMELRKMLRLLLYQPELNACYLLAKMEPVIKRREEFVQSLSVGSPWSASEWEKWYTKRPLSELHMHEIQEIWKNELSSQIENKGLEKKLDPKNGGARKKCLRGRFKAHLEFSIGCKQLAYSFLMYHSSRWMHIVEWCRKAVLCRDDETHAEWRQRQDKLHLWKNKSRALWKRTQTAIDKSDKGGQSKEKQVPGALTWWQ